MAYLNVHTNPDGAPEPRPPQGFLHGPLEGRREPFLVASIVGSPECRLAAQNAQIVIRDATNNVVQAFPA